MVFVLRKQVNVLSVSNLSKSYGLLAVLKKITFSLNRGERAALVGHNGCGKTTLLNIIAGEESPDAGSVSFTPADLRVGYLHQGIVFAPDETAGGYLNRFSVNLEESLFELEAASVSLARSPEDPACIATYTAALQPISPRTGTGRRPQNHPDRF